jgi:metal-responsive CopG/Arc/MetJ family transcriptional regulator
MQQNIAKGISLPEDVLRKIDSLRGDISRSKYLLRILEKYLEYNNQDSPDRRFENLQSSESRGM